MRQIIFYCLILGLLWGCGKNDQCHAEDIAESKSIMLNGQAQFVMIRGADRNNPVLLHLHGGPGVSEIGGLRKYNKDLEQDFTVVYWDQRNAGKSYSEDFAPAEIKVNKYIEDVNAMVLYLKRKLKVNKVLLVGHSWGSRLGLLAVKKYPEHFAAFVSTGQEVAAGDGELQSYRYTLSKAKELKKTEFVQQLEAIGEPVGGDYRTMYPTPEGFSLQKYILLELNKTIYNGITVENLYANFQESTEYTPQEKSNYLKSAEFTNTHIMQDADFNNFDLRVQVPEVKVPVFFIVGKYDYVNPTPLAKAYFSTLKAPKKELIQFENSGHDPAWEEAERYRTELLRIQKSVQ